MITVELGHDWNHGAVTEALAQLLAQPQSVAALLEDYLRRREDRLASRDSGPRDTNSQYDADRRWSIDLSGENSVLPAVVAIAHLEAARQHLRAVSALLVLDDVDQAVLASSRACVEASARAMHVIDVAVSEADRFARASNELWDITKGSGEQPGKARVALQQLAATLGIDHEVKKGVAQFGAEPRPSMRTSLRQGLAAVGYPADHVERVLPFWNGAAHAGVDAGLLTFAIRGGEGLVGDNARINAALAALTAFGRAEALTATYQGYASAVEDDFNDQLSP